MSSDIVKATAVQMSQQQSPVSSDLNIDLILQSLMIDDTDVKRILKGEIHEPLNRFRQCITDLSATALDCYKFKTIDDGQGKEILFQIQESQVMMARIELQLARYYHMVPYLLMLSPLVRLSNIDGKRVDAYCRKIGIMIGRDKLMSSWEEESYETHNFYDALQMLIELALHESQEGWKARIVTEEKKQVITEIHDRSASSQRKKRFGLF
jgi:hypothetical protein